MWRVLAVLRRNLQNIKKSHRVADENMVVADGGRPNGSWNGLSVICSVVRAPFSLVSCFSQPHVNGADGVWVSSHEFAQISEMNHLMVSDSMRYAILM
ncbi:hypothetical protein like AT5G35732 [Hibiscus trionum]|uniref:Uncharacterized protein n=1 Tax=Hibiscus trionum TaxID=183268 RepID=A0A9W7LLI2_HIBTR|nr:hypothetical protein like AT5G35732 [Hibiscus trionum]